MRVPSHRLAASVGLIALAIAPSLWVKSLAGLLVGFTAYHLAWRRRDPPS